MQRKDKYNEKYKYKYFQAQDIDIQPRKVSNAMQRQSQSKPGNVLQTRIMYKQIDEKTEIKDLAIENAGALQNCCKNSS